MKLENAIILDGEVYTPRYATLRGMDNDRLLCCSHCDLYEGQTLCLFCNVFEGASSFRHEGKLMDILITQKEGEE